MANAAEATLRKGLVTGYAGGSEPRSVKRGPFTIKSSHHSFPEQQAEYLDEWIFQRTGGGQEIAQYANDIATRVFAGGVIRDEKLKELGITHDQVISYFRAKLSEVADRTRLHENVVLDPDGDWQYRYEVQKEVPELPMTIGLETVTYTGHTVFIHVFLITPIA